MLWSDIYSALAWRLPKSDASPQHRLNRLAREHFPSLETALGELTCSAARHSLSASAIATVVPWHTRARPARTDGSVILFSYEGKLVVIDGSNRVNFHRAAGSGELLPAIIITVRA